MGYAVASAVILSIIGLLDYGVWLAVNFLLGNSTFPPDRVSSASTLVMQIDSFLAAGYIVAIFQLQADMAKRIQVRLNVLNRARELRDVNLPGFGFHSLKGSRKGEYALMVNANYRLTFRFENSDVLDLNLEDYH